MNVGSVVARRWAIEAIAGTGGMCSVYRARAPSGGLVAVKVLHQSAIDAEERFAREVRLLQDLRHPAIVRYLDSGTTEDGERFLVMEWLDGTDVEALLRARSLTLGEVMTLASRVAQALAVAHARGIVHRDVKPSNIFVVGDDVSLAKLLDFGVARWGADTGRAVTITGTSVGTPAYMAPEQVRGERVIDARADVFALGCVIYECLTGEPAFAAHNPMAVFCKILVDRSPRAGELIPGLPEPIDELLTSMLDKEPGNRPRDGAAVAAALESLSERIDAAASISRPSQAVRLRKTITGDEQRLVNVLVAGPSVGGANHNAGEARTVRLFPSKVPSLNMTPSTRASVRFDALGDGSLIAVFEARGVASDQAMNAARFALALRDEFPNGDIALATGLAFMGKTKLVGEAIDRACHLLLGETKGGLERAAPKGVRLDDVTAGLIGARFDVAVDDLGPVLRGARQATGERTLLGKPTPFVGRVRELTVLTSTLDECVSGQVARAVLVTGQAGSGKSRLLRELLKHVEERGGIEVWSAQGDPMRSGSALDMLAEAVRRLTGVLDGEPPPVRRHKLRAEVSRHVAAGQVTRVSDFLGELLRLPPANDDSVPLRAARQDPMLMGDQVRRAIEDLLDARTADHPVVLVLEDLHWGDAATVACVDRALRNLGERRLMIVALARPELSDQFPRIWATHNVTELRLGPLSRRAAQSLAEAVLGDKLPPERAAELVERADGNPFYLEELLRTAATGVYALPETLLAMMQARIEALEPEARRVLRAASIFGVVFWRGGVAGLTEALALDHWLEVLAEREFISLTDDTKFAGERAYRFRHDIVRDAAYALLVDDDRRLGHILAGEWLERVGETDARALAQHFDRAEVPARALPLYLRAAEMALERGDFAAVFDLAQRVEACGPDRAELGLLRCLEGDAHYWRGEPAPAEKHYVAAMGLLPRGSRRWYHAAGHAMIVWGADHAVERMESVGRTLTRHVGLEDDHIGRLVAQAITASRLFLAGRRELAHSLLEAAEAAAGDLSEADAVVAAHLHRALASRALVRDADPALFLREMELGADSFEEIGDARETCFQRANIGYAQLELGLYADAERELRSALATAERMALDHVASGARGNLAMALARQGKLRDAIALETRAATWFEEQKDRRLAGGSRMYLAIILLLDGDLERAEHEARTALALLDDRAPAQATATLASVLLARGATAEALEHASVAARQLEGGGAFEGEAEVRLIHAEALFASGRLTEARAAIAAATIRLDERAERIGHAEWRRSFLENIPEHVRTYELARAWREG